ncbi:MAG TPA: ABC transporter permease, partial [Humibacillus xanthopallidus]|nr:ABC transporter permease [Humibacillus xanthopallidus]
MSADVTKAEQPSGDPGTDRTGAVDPVAQQGPPVGGMPSRPGGIAGVLGGPLGRNAGLVVALVLLIIVGIITAGDRFASP